MNEEQKEIYDEFIRHGLNAGFTDRQINFMWEFIMIAKIIKPSYEKNKI